MLTVQEPAAKMLAHRQPVRSVAVDRSGNYLATSATDKTLKIWDIRAFKCLQEYRVGASVFKRPSLPKLEKYKRDVQFSN